MINAEIVLDSISESGTRITTFELTLPKDLLAQLNTHRVLSKNASSARAIPIKKFISSVSLNPVIPIWTKNQPGMVGKRVEDETLSEELTSIWLEARDAMIAFAEKLADKGAHKQTVNRLLSPFFYTKVVCTATDLDWFFFLRDSGSAQEEIALLARCMKEALDKSVPTVKAVGEWHIPYILPEEEHLSLDVKVKISVARCARVSYKAHDDDLISTLEKDLKLYNQLFEDKHASPWEHQAYASADKDLKNSLTANFRGWIQHRKTLDLN